MHIQTTPTVDGTGRRYDLDWVRVGAFALLILYHVGMFYVTWGWHVKSDHLSRLAEPVMSLLNPWRLALLFFISGVAIRFASDKQSIAGFGLDKLRRLLPPIVVGMQLIVPPQTYFELRFKEAMPPDVWPFYRSYLDLTQVYPMITPTWNHLWYVVYMLVYSLLLAPLLPLLRRLATVLEPFMARLTRSGAVWVVFVPLLPFLFYQLALAPHFPTTHALFDDWANHANSLTILLVGYFAAKSDGFWKAVDRALPVAAAIAGGLAICVLFIRANRGMLAGIDMRDIYGLLRVVYAWTAILTILGFAQRYLNRESRALGYLSEAVFPYYILHQTIIVVVAFQFIGSNISLGYELAAILLATFGGCALLHEFVIRRSRFLRPLFGLKPTRGPVGFKPASALPGGKG